jgi:hypothetical protein
MDLLVDILLVLLAVVGVLVALALVAPLHVRASGEVDAESLHAAYRFRVRWALGLLGLDVTKGERTTLRLCGLPIARLASDDASPKRRKSRKKPRKKPRKSRPGPGLIWLMRHRQELWNNVLHLIGTLHIRARITGAIGLPEPDDTVWLALALDQLEARLPDSTLDLEVDYSDAVFDVEGNVSAWVIPLQVLVVGLVIYLFTDLGRAVRGQRPPPPKYLDHQDNGPARATETTP